MHDRSCAAGLAACAVQWGAWHGVGMVAANTSVLARMRRGGIGTVGPTAGLGVLQQLLGSSLQACQVRLVLVMSMLHGVLSHIKVLQCWLPWL